MANKKELVYHLESMGIDTVKELDSERKTQLEESFNLTTEELETLLSAFVEKDGKIRDLVEDETPTE